MCVFVLCFSSDLKIKVGDRRISAHKFVLAARSETWSLANLVSTEELDLSGRFLIGWGGVGGERDAFIGFGRAVKR